MATTTSVEKLHRTAATLPWARIATVLEVLAIYSGILLYIWRWQSRYPRLWMALLALVIFSHFLHRDKLQDLGIALRGLRSNAELALPLAIVLFLPLLIYGFATHRLVLWLPNRECLIWFGGYGSWCVFQQYLMQSYFHRRLMSVIQNRHLSSVAVALMFGGAHIPNLILIVATTLGGFFLAEVFARRPNIWPLALAQCAGGFLIAAISPVAAIHNMQIGPGYYNYHPS